MLSCKPFHTTIGNFFGSSTNFSKLAIRKVRFGEPSLPLANAPSMKGINTPGKPWIQEALPPFSPQEAEYRTLLSRHSLRNGTMVRFRCSRFVGERHYLTLEAQDSVSLLVSCIAILQALSIPSWWRQLSVRIPSNRRKDSLLIDHCCHPILFISAYQECKIYMNVSYVKMAAKLSPVKSGWPPKAILQGQSQYKT